MNDRLEFPPECSDIGFAQFHSRVYGDIRDRGGDELNLRGRGRGRRRRRVSVPIGPIEANTRSSSNGHGSSDPHGRTDIRSMSSVSMNSSCDQDFKSIDVVKIDIEGSEVRALRGAVNLIQKYQPLLIVEIGEEIPLDNGSTTSELRDFFAARGYVLFDVTKGKPRLVDLAGEHGANVVAVPERFLDSVLRLGGMDRSALTAGLAPDCARPTQIRTTKESQTKRQ